MITVGLLPRFRYSRHCRPVPHRGRMLVLAVCMLLASAVVAAPVAVEAATAIRSAPHDGYGRMVFDWDGPVRWSADIAAGQLVLQFSEPVTDDPRKVLGPLKDYVSTVRVSDDRRTLTFPLKGGYRLNSFTLGSAVVVDLMKDGAQPPAAPVPQAAAPAPAEPVSTPVGRGPALAVRTGTHPGYERLVFDWPKAPKYTVEQQPGSARITFQSPARIDTAAVNAALPDVLKGVRASATNGGLTVTVPVPEGGRVRHFATGPKVVLDVLLPEEAATKVAEDARTPAAPASQTAAAPPAKPDPAKTPEATPKSAPPQPAPSQPAPSQPAAEPAKAQPGASEPGKPAASDPAAPPAAKPADAAPSPAAAALEAAMRGQLGGAAPETPPQAAAETPAAAPDSGPQTQFRQARVASLAFSWNEPTAAAVFRRGEWIWAVFDRYQEVDLRLLKRLGGDIVDYVEQVPSRTATVVRMLVAPGYNPSVRREGLLWIVDLMRQPYRPAHPIEVEPQPRSPVGPRLYLPVAEGGKAMVLLDPEIGDRFMVVPVVPLGNGIYPAHSYPDADLPVTVQGVLVEPRSDRIVVNSTRNGVDVTAQGGMLFSPDIAEMKAMAAVGADTDMTRVLDIQAWMRGPDEEFLDQKQTLQTAVANAPPSRRGAARLDLARFFFAHGFEAEALGILRTIATDSPEMVNSAAFRALRGAASHLMGRYGDAIEDLSHPSLAGIQEADFWRAAAQAELGDPALQALTLRDYGGVIGAYPRWVKVPLALTAATATVAAVDDLATNSFLAAAKVDDNTPHEEAAIAYIEAKLAENAGNFDTALEQYQFVTDGNDRYFRALASRDRLNLLYRLEELDRPNLIKGLERLRFSWRGGNFEFNLLMQLGDLYEAEQDWGKALRVWQQAAIYFEDRPGADEAAKRMQDTFEKLFYDGVADAMEPIKAIALYDEFRELTPTGPRGDEMIRRLADRLVGVDLLQQAAMLLERQIKYRLDGVERARVGARLGLVYLLDRAPDQAVQALLKTRDPDVPDRLERQRQRLMSRALADMDRPEEAIALLQGDESREADMLRTEVFWKSGEWRKAADTLERLLPEVKTDTVLTSDQARLILDEATALTLAQDENGVAMLRRKFMPVMQKTPFKDAFDLITTTPEGGLIDYRTIADRIKQAEDFKSFLASYQERLRNEGLSAIN